MGNCPVLYYISNNDSQKIKQFEEDKQLLINIRLYNNICNYYHTLSKYKPHKVDTDSHSVDAVNITALTFLMKKI